MCTAYTNMTKTVRVLHTFKTNVHLSITEDLTLTASSMETHRYHTKVAES